MAKALVFACIVGPALLGVRAAAAQAPAAANVAPAEAPTMVVEVARDVLPVEPAAVRAAIARELRRAVVAPDAVEARGAQGRLTIALDSSRRIVMTYRDPSGRVVARTVAMPSDPTAILATITLLAGNLARNEAADLADTLAAIAPPAPAPAPAPADQAIATRGSEGIPPASVQTPTPAPAPTESALPPVFVDVDRRRPSRVGDVCTDVHACGQHLQCRQGVCAANEPRGARPDEDFYRFGFDVGGGVGFAYVDGSPSYAEFRDYDGDESLGGGPFGRTCGLPRADASPSDPDAGTLLCPGVVPSSASSPGFAATGYVLLNARVNVLRWLGFGATVRVQPDAAPNGILPFMLAGARSYFAFTPSGFTRNGIVGSVFAGAGVGQIQPRAPASCAGPCTRPSAHLSSGLLNAHAGARVEYGLAGIVHLGAELQLNLQFTTLLFDVDLHGFAGLHF